MALPLLRLIGLRHNQIEHDNCVPVTFSLTRAGAPGEGRGARARAYVHASDFSVRALPCVDGGYVISFMPLT